MILPVNRDTFYTTTGSDFRFRISVGNTIIYEGKAYAKPSTEEIEINVSRICRNYLSNELPVIETEDTVYQHVNALKHFVLSAYDKTTDTWSDVETYDFLWYYDDTEEIPYKLSDPVNGHSAIGARNLLTTYDITSGVTTSIKTSDEVIGCEYREEEEGGGGGGDTPTPTPDYRKYLKFDILSAGEIVWSGVTIGGNVYETTIEYQKNGGSWTSITNGIIPVNAGDVVQFRGNNTYIQTSFKGTGRYNVSGNVMSLFNKNNFENMTAFPSQGSNLNNLFSNTEVVDASGLLLPARTLTRSCYSSMFLSCASLTKAPVLPATNLAQNCYSSMFRNCTSLTTAPQLPATNLADSCYRNMFINCTNLVNAPVLPATTLEGGCYRGMFEDCRSLTKAPVLPATNLAQNCYSSMFRNCTSLTTAPQLPATTYVTNSYDLMFDGCSNLNYIKCLIYSGGPYTFVGPYNWVRGVASTGTFVKNRRMTNWKIDATDGIPVGWTVVDDDSGDKEEERQYYTEQYLTLDIISGGTISIDNNNTGTKTIEYSKNNGSWTSLVLSSSISVASGDKIRLRGNNLENINIHNSTDCKFNVFGNIMSLVYGDSFADKTSLTKDSQFYLLFYQADVVDASNLILPSTTLRTGCYRGMFRNCPSLTTAPVLPATNLAQNCYYEMFYECPSLTAAPELPATSLANDCYNGMFKNCTSLTTAPSLPATELGTFCYSRMFEGCTNLVGVPSLPSTRLSQGCYTYMFSGCISLQTAPTLPANTLVDGCYCGMFGSCTSLTTAPVLPAKTLAPYCYDTMFSNSTNLNYIKCLATDISATDCTYMWTNNVASTGTFVKDPNMSSWTTGYNGIPSGWTVVNNGDEEPETDYSTMPLTFEITGNGNIVWKASNTGLTTTIEYKINNGSWTSITATTAGVAIPVSSGEKVEFRGNNAAYGNEVAVNKTETFNGFIGSTAQFKVYGNIMSLINSTNFSTLTTLSSGYTFHYLFWGCTGLTDASNLILPATTLVESCYRFMFYNCTSLVQAPELPATTLSDKCYFAMFLGCTSLTTAPSSIGTSDTTLATDCCAYMFRECTSLTTAPELPATTLADGCYRVMFRDCTNLNYIKCLATYIPREYSVLNWVAGVASTGTFVKNPSMSGWTTGNSGIPSGWTVQDNSRSLRTLKAAPLLGATVVEYNDDRLNGYVVCYCGEFALYYLNRRGGWDTFLFEGRCKRIDRYDIYKYKKVYDNNTIEFSSKRYMNQVTETYELNSGWLTEDQSRRFAYHLLSTNNAYLHILGEDRIIPVNITDAQAEYKKYNDNGGVAPINYTITVENSQTKERK